jgi:2-polyprenyl-3-methyl-5-hydroxy-6-metoxy-1,4-benzoquinol methylase
MSKEDWLINPIHVILKKASLWPFIDGEIETVLDVACGLSLKSKYLGAKNILGVDINERYLKAIESEVPYAVVKYDVRKMSNIFIDNSFDVVYALDIIEHLYKEESVLLIEQCKKIAKRAVIIETPNGYVPQNLDIQGFGAHEYQTHRCGWTVDELEKMEFKCVLRKYIMQNVQRHTEIDVDPNIELIEAIYIKE